MHEFYTTIAEYYEYIFPFNPIQVQFLENSSSGKRILDVACATGIAAAALAERSFELTAIDLNDALVQRAKEKQGITVHKRNMLDLQGLGDNFDLVYCIGNSLPHLDNEEEIKQFLLQCYSVLRDGATLVLQFINFEKFWNPEKDQLGSLPTIKNKTLEFEREYFREGNKIRFHTQLTAGGRSIKNDVLLYPLFSQRCVELLKETGFDKIELFGAFDASPFKPEISMPVIVRAKKA